VINWILTGSFVDVLAPGVFFTGMVKDFFCLPRPLSPPLQRITMSGSTALEYGFPSTHSANAISVALYCLTLLDRSDDRWFYSLSKTALELLAWFYAGCVVMGRMYCGMHGFLGISFVWPQSHIQTVSVASESESFYGGSR